MFFICLIQVQGTLSVISSVLESDLAKIRVRGPVFPECPNFLCNLDQDNCIESTEQSCILLFKMVSICVVVA